MSKITFQEILEANEVLGKLAKKDMPFKSSYQIAKLLKKLSFEVKFIHEKRMELFRKFGKPDEKDKDAIRVEEDRKEEFLKEMNELLATTPDFTFQKVKIEYFEPIAPAPVDLVVLEKFIEEPIFAAENPKPKEEKV